MSDPKRGTNRARKPAAASPRRPDGPSWTQCRPDCVPPRGRQAHCSICHRTFTTAANFDKHRRGGNCVDPATLGMVTAGRGIWRIPMTDEDRKRMEWSR